MPCLKITILTLNISKEVGAADKLQQIRNRFETDSSRKPTRSKSLTAMLDCKITNRYIWTYKLKNTKTELFLRWGEKIKRFNVIPELKFGSSETRKDIRKIRK